MATRDTLKRLVPTMASLADAVLDEWLADAVLELDVTEWPELIYPRAACYLAGHLYTRAQQMTVGSGAGGVNSESAGGMSRSYGSPGASSPDAEYETTACGVEFIRLRKTHCAGVYALFPDETYSLRG